MSVFFSNSGIYGGYDDVVETSKMQYMFGPEIIRQVTEFPKIKIKKIDNNYKDIKIIIINMNIN